MTNYNSSTAAISESELCSPDLHPMIRYIELHDRQNNVTEVEIPIPYGKIAGKWFGPKNVQPILCIHGWLDNCGTFDRLIPLLPADVSFLAIDLPGHGHSSWVPNGMAYHQLDNVVLILQIMKEYNWDKVAIMAHSMGAIIGFMFTALFPEKVELYIGIDALKPHSYYPGKFVKYVGPILSKFIEADKRNCEKSEPPSYTYEEMLDRMYDATFESVTKETAPFLLQRNIKPSKKFPGKYYFDRDNKVKYNNIPGWSDEVNWDLGKRVKVPQLTIKAQDSPYPGSWEGFKAMSEVLKEHNPLYEVEYVKASHHVHLTDPELIAPMITKFLVKYWIKRQDSLVSKL